MLVLVLVLVLFGQSACSRDSDRSASSGVTGGTAVIGGYVDLRTMNPLATLPDVNKAIERYALYTPLILFDSLQRPQPWLASSWDTTRIGRDSLQLTFHLRRDVRWHDGVPVTSRDVAFTFERARDPVTGYADAYAFAPYSPRVETPDSFTVVLRLHAHPDFLEPWFLLPPLPEHVLGDVAPADLPKHAFGSNPLGSGPFRFVRREPGAEWVFERNPSFPAALGGPPKLDRLIYRTIPEQTALVTELLTGRVDLGQSIRPAQMGALATSDELRIVQFPSSNWIFLGFNTRLPFFDTREERQALALAIDRGAIVQGIMGGLNVLGRGTLTPVHWAFDSTDARTMPRYDPARARELLEQAGWHDRDGDGVREDPTGRKLHFPLMVWSGSGSYQEMAQVIQSQWRDVGVNASIRVVEFNTFVAQIDGTASTQRAPGARLADDTRKREFAAAIGNWTDNLRKDDSQLFHSRNASGPRFWSGFSSPRLDALIDTLAVTMDTARARPLWREYQELIVDEAPLVVLFYARGINGARRDLHGLNEDWRGPVASVQHWWK